MCTAKRARLVIISQVIFSLVFYSYTLWTTEIKHDAEYNLYMCTVKEKYADLTQIMMIVDSFITLAIPSIAIIGLNIRIALAIYQFLRKRHEATVRQENLQMNSFTMNEGSDKELSHAENGNFDATSMGERLQLKGK